MSVYFNHPSQGNLTTISFFVLETRLHLPQVHKWVSFLPSKWNIDTITPFFFPSHPQESSLCSQPIRGKVCQTGRIFLEHVEWSFLDPKLHCSLLNCLKWVHEVKVHPVKNKLSSLNFFQVHQTRRCPMNWCLHVYVKYRYLSCLVVPEMFQEMKSYA